MSGLIAKALTYGGKGNSGSYTYLDITDKVDKLPTLLTYTAGDFIFEFKIPEIPVFLSNVSNTVLVDYPRIYFVCKNFDSIISVNSNIITTQINYGYRLTNIDIGNPDGYLISYTIKNPKITNIYINSTTKSHFMLDINFDLETKNEDTGGSSIASYNYASVYLAFSGGGTTYNIFSTLEDSPREAMGTYGKAISDLQKTI